MAATLISHTSSNALELDVEITTFFLTGKTIVMILTYYNHYLYKQNLLNFVKPLGSFKLSGQKTTQIQI